MIKDWRASCLGKGRQLACIISSPNKSEVSVMTAVTKAMTTLTNVWHLRREKKSGWWRKGRCNIITAKRSDVQTLPQRNENMSADLNFNELRAICYYKETVYFLPDAPSKLLLPALESCTEERWFCKIQMNQLLGEINKAIERIPNSSHVFLISKRKSGHIHIKSTLMVDETMHLREPVVSCPLILLKHSISRNRWIKNGSHVVFQVGK